MRFSWHSGRHAVPPVSGSRASRATGPREQPTVPVPAQHRPVDHPSGPLPVPPEERLVDEDPATVEVVASRSTARMLEEVAPRTWRIVATERPSHHPCVDFVVFHEPDAALVVDAIERQPGAEVVVLLARTAPTERIVAMLDAGVSICLRESPARLVAGHMLARRRRGGPRRRPRVDR
jgi:hypothetical protein